MFTKHRILFCLILSTLSAKVGWATDTRYYINTPRGSDVPDTYQTDEMQTWDRSGWDNYYATNYPNATQIVLPGEQYSSSRTFNCHGYAWWYVLNGQRLWIGYSQAGAEEIFWNDGSYDQVAEGVCTKISYSGDHSAIPSGTANYYYSKWNRFPLMYHHKDYTPGYGTANQFFRRAIEVPTIYSTIEAALAGRVSGDIVHVVGSVGVNSSPTIQSGITLKVYPGVTLSFGSYCKLRVEGKLIANGTTFTRSGGQWYGIEFYNGNSGSSIQYCTIENAQYGVYAYGSDAYLSNNTIRYNSNGAYVFASSNSIGWNLFENNMYGVQCAYYGDANIQVNNVFRYNGWAVYADGYSTPNLGSYIGYNSFYWNDYYDVYSNYGGTIYARGNWWGDYPAYPSIYGNVDYSNELSFDPNNWAGAMARPVGLATKQDLRASGEGMGILDGDTTGVAELNAAYRSLHNSDSLGAFTAFRSILERHPDRFVGSRAIVTAFNLAGRLRVNGRQLLDDAISRHPSTRLSGTAKLLLVGLLLKGEESGQALGVSTSLIHNPDSIIAKHALFNAGNIAWYRLKNERLGENHFRELIARFPGDPLSESASATLGEDTSPGAGPKKYTADSEVKAFTLRECYPNPFNPSTQINYELPEAAHVSLIVYDILGRKVAELVNGYQETGARTATWLAHDVASGVYFARFTATDPNGIVRLSKLMKLILAK